MNWRNYVMPLYIGVIAGTTSHGIADPKFWVLIVIGNACLLAERAK